MNRLVVICPDGLRPKGDNLAAAAGDDIGYIDTFTESRYEDLQGNLYSVVSTIISDEFKARIESLLVRPDFDTDSVIDMTLAQQGQLLIDFDLTDVVNKLSARYVDNTQQAHSFIAEAGLTRIVSLEN